jgi:phosphoglycolate/pyridoxal phosphate phosphatase family enzyme
MLQSSLKSLNKVHFWSVVTNYDNFFFDCDGVLFNGTVYMKESFEVLNELTRLGKNVFFMTNMSKSSRKNLYDKLVLGGYTPEMDHLFTSSYLAARYLSLNHPEVEKVYLVGLSGLREEIEEQGFTVVGGHEDDDKKMNGDMFDQLEVDEKIGAVVAALDFDFNYYKLAYASILLQRGAHFIATNQDSNVKMRRYKMPGGGCMVKAIEHAFGKTPYVVGKPNPAVIEIATQAYGLNKKRCLMVGDRLDTDIQLGKNAGIDTFAVLSGVSSEEDILNETLKEDGTVPTYYGERVEMIKSQPMEIDRLASLKL